MVSAPGGATIHPLSALPDPPSASSTQSVLSFLSSILAASFLLFLQSPALPAPPIQRPSFSRINKNERCLTDGTPAESCTVICQTTDTPSLCRVTMVSSSGQIVSVKLWSVRQSLDPLPICPPSSSFSAFPPRRFKRDIYGNRPWIPLVALLSMHQLCVSLTYLCVYNAFLSGVLTAPRNHHHRVYLHSRGIVHAPFMHYPTPKLS